MVEVVTKPMKEICKDIVEMWEQENVDAASYAQNVLGELIDAHADFYTRSAIVRELAKCKKCRDTVLAFLI